MSAAPATYTPSDAIDMSKERDWPANLGMLDWDNTSIVFTKRSLVEFLKYAGVTVDPNFTNIQKLPRYAKFGKISGETATVNADEGSAGSESAATAVQESSVAGDFKPTRRVRDPPGGVTHRIFGDLQDDDVLATAPPKPSTAAPVALHAETKENVAAAAENRPETKTRTSSVAGLWDAPKRDDGFKPTRRVREMPGGKDSISGLFGA
ncbi:hypothetical protein PYCCODRAFT_1440042 [Trametes coccinea BRFM310]|uniref:Uncharacterized protein n=1 Tax=Trametes coccinea (strain BRFM310) TaxID=1353009 RepID=A0A1Y2I956_TRAC3|nr:hypothetical protein PYCCODRAFT_1440042 [Trametes coccinea BRFM310]